MPEAGATPELSVPASTRARLGWRSRALQGAQSLCATLPFSFSALTRLNRILEWHELLTRRFTRWPAWGPAVLDFGAETNSERNDETPAMTLTTFRQDRRENPPVQTGMARALRPHGAGHAPVSWRRGAPRERPAGETIRDARPAAQIGEHETGFVIAQEFDRDAQRRLEMPEITLALKSDQRPAEGFVPEPLFFSLPQFYKAQDPVPLIQLSVTPVRRREVTGVFPPPEPPMTGKPLSEATLGEPTLQARSIELGAEAAWEAARRSIVALSLRSSAAGPPAKQEMLTKEKAPEGSRSGVEIRLVRPEIADTNQDGRTGERDEVNPQATAPPAPVAPPAPQIDINAITEKVYQALLRRERFERERRGR